MTGITFADSYIGGEPLVEVEGEMLTLWPAGRPGPLLQLSADTWQKLDGAVRSALARGRLRGLPNGQDRLNGFTAHEGINNIEED